MTQQLGLTKGQRTRNELVNSAKRLFFSQGYTATGVDQIVGSIGLTSGVFYANFKSKEELLIHIVSLQIETSKQVLFFKKENESNYQWLLRVVATYLSSQHRDQIEASCPLTSLSQEMIKLGLDQKTGLASYVQEFESIVRERLNEEGLSQTDIASALISMCVGAVQCARLIADKKLSDFYLKDVRRLAVRMILADGHQSLAPQGNA